MDPNLIKCRGEIANFSAWHPLYRWNSQNIEELSPDEVFELFEDARDYMRTDESDDDDEIWPSTSSFPNPSASAHLNLRNSQSSRRLLSNDAEPPSTPPSSRSYSTHRITSHSTSFFSHPATQDSLPSLRNSASRASTLNTATMHDTAATVSVLSPIRSVTPTDPVTPTAVVPPIASVTRTHTRRGLMPVAGAPVLAVEAFHDAASEAALTHPPQAVFTSTEQTDLAALHNAPQNDRTLPHDRAAPDAVDTANTVDAANASVSDVGDSGVYDPAMFYHGWGLRRLLLHTWLDKIGLQEWTGEVAGEGDHEAAVDEREAAGGEANGAAVVEMVDEADEAGAGLAAAAVDREEEAVAPGEYATQPVAPAEAALRVEAALLPRELLTSTDEVTGRSLLHDMATHGTMRALRVVLAAGDAVDVDAVDGEGSTALSLAAWAGRREAVEALLAAGACVDVRAVDGSCAVMHAAAAGDDVLAAVVAAGARVYEGDGPENRRGISDFHPGMGGCGAESVELRPLCDVDGVSVLWHACAGGDAAAVQRVLLEYRRQAGNRCVSGIDDRIAAIVNLPDGRGLTPLMVASALGHTEAARALLAARADLDTRDHYATTALMHASEAARGDVVALLLQARADASLRDSNGRDALELVCGGEGTDDEGARVSIVGLLLAAQETQPRGVHGVPPGRGVSWTGNGSGCRALVLAVRRDREQVVATLLRARAAVLDRAERLDCWENKVGKREFRRRKSALMVAAQRGHERIVRLLLEAAATEADAHAAAAAVCEENAEDVRLASQTGVDQGGSGVECGSSGSRKRAYQTEMSKDAEECSDINVQNEEGATHQRKRRKCNDYGCVIC